MEEADSPSEAIAPAETEEDLVEPQTQIEIQAAPQSAKTTPNISPSKSRTSPARTASIRSAKSNKSDNVIKSIDETMSGIGKEGKQIGDRVSELTATIKELSDNLVEPDTPVLSSNIDRIAQMSKILTDEANALRASIKSLSDDIDRTKVELETAGEDVNYPYHLFLVELIINKIHMKCECFELDCNNLVITAEFLGKQPVTLFDNNCQGKVEHVCKLNAGKSILFAMTYDKICSIKEFEFIIRLTKQPPCSSCITKLGETCIDYTTEFVDLREELSRKWSEERPCDNILCTTSTPLKKNMYYLKCGGSDKLDAIGVMEVSIRLSFLGKEITTAFSGSAKGQGTSFLLKEDNGVTMYACQKVEMDDHGKVLLDEDSMSRKPTHYPSHYPPNRGTESPMSLMSSKRSAEPYREPENVIRGSEPKYPESKYDEIYTKMNANELKIRVPKTPAAERSGKYDRIQELCECEDNSYNTGEQIQFELPKDLCKPDKSHNTYSSNLKYTYKGCDKVCDPKDRKTVNITPSNCPVPCEVGKLSHPNKDVFILKIGKKFESKDKKTDLEIELVTPKLPTEVNGTSSTQWTDPGGSEGKKKKKGKKDGKDGKKDAKAKGKKAKKGKSQTSVGKKGKKGKKKK